MITFVHIYVSIYNNWRIATKGVERRLINNEFYTYYFKIVRKNIQHLNYKYMNMNFKSFSTLKDFFKTPKISILEKISKLNIDIDYIYHNKKLSKHELKDIKSAKINYTDYFYYKMFKSYKDYLIVKKYFNIEFTSSFLNFKSLNYLVNNAKKMSNYIKDNNIKYINDYLDYIESLYETNSLSNKTMYPLNFWESKELAIKKSKDLSNTKYDIDIQQKYSDAKAISLNDNLIIEPYKSYSELKNESDSLSHCIKQKNYVVQYSKSEILLLKLRRKNDIDKPYYSVEIRSGALVQCRGKNNKSNMSLNELIIRNMTKIFNSYLT